jgi:calcineurin-like phosphoesterase family protein
MKTYVTSDLHFGHGNILKFNPATRPYTDKEHMIASLTHEWNATVNHDDLVYILGDVAFCHADKATAIVRRLNGRKILIRGNHDSKLLKDAGFVDCFEEIHDYRKINYNGHQISMFHYPIAHFDQCHRGALHFHGHLHGAVSGLEKFRVLDVGVDAFLNGRPVALIEDAIAQAVKGELIPHGTGEYTAD